MKQVARALAISPKGAAQITSLSPSVIDNAIRAGVLPAKHFGNRTLIFIRDLEKWLESLPDGRAAARPQLEGKRTGRPRKVATA